MAYPAAFLAAFPATCLGPVAEEAVRGRARLEYALHTEVAARRRMGPVELVHRSHSQIEAGKTSGRPELAEDTGD